MDILISSNLERLLYVTLGSDKTAEYMKNLAADGKYSLTSEELSLINESFVGYYTSEDETKETIKETYENKNCLIDTHTAVAVHAAQCYANDSKAERKILAVSTASPYKFARDVYVSVTEKEPESDISALSELSEFTNVPIPAPLANLAGKKIIHEQVIDKSEMEDATLAFARV
jgi:threonine synthase